MKLSSTVLDAPDAQELADFYVRLLGWEKRADDDEPDWVVIEAPGGAGGALAFQTEPLYVPPVWPTESGVQGMMLHLDFEVEDLAAETARAVEVGAKLADYQPQDDVRVLLDPAGHPFCLWVETPE